jgi:hypothetical protein
MMIASLVFNLPIHLVGVHGGPELAGDLSSSLVILSDILLCGLLIGICLCVFFARSRFDRAVGYQAACFLVITAVILSRVLSPQYFIWSIPLAFLLAIEIFPRRQSLFWILTLLLAVIGTLTTWIFPYHFLQSPTTPLALLPSDVHGTIASLPACALGLRNGLYLAMAIWLGVFLVRKIVGVTTLSSGR